MHFCSEFIFRVWKNINISSNILRVSINVICNLSLMSLITFTLFGVPGTIKEDFICFFSFFLTWKNILYKNKLVCQKKKSVKLICRNIYKFIITIIITLKITIIPLKITNIILTKIKICNFFFKVSCFSTLCVCRIY